MTKLAKRLTTFLLAGTLITGLIPGFSNAALADSATTCHAYRLPVTLSPIDLTTYHVFGQLCYQGSPHGKTIQMLVHGATYDHNYWNWPLSPQKYSYVRQATDAGYATFAIDRIGVGNSDHPLSTLVTLQANAYVDHQLVLDLRRGIVGGTSFAKVILVGHSLGSEVSLYQQATYADANALILLGFSHQLNAVFFAAHVADFYPAALDPKFADGNFPGIYLTSVPGTRAANWYNVADADPNVIALDENLKQTLTDGEEVTSLIGFDPTISQAVHVPVLLAIGQDDNDLCADSNHSACASAATFLSLEEPDFSTSGTCLEAFVLPYSGHVINLHRNAHDWFETAANWANRRVGNSVSTPPTSPCQQ